MIKSVFYGAMLDINPVKDHPGGIKKTDRDFAINLNYDGIEFPVQEKDFKKLKHKIIFVLMCFVMKINWFFQFIFLIKHLKAQ